MRTTPTSMSMAKDKAGDIWMATYGAGVWRYDGKTLTNYPILVDGNPITVFSIYNDRQDGLWLGTHEHRVCKFNGESFEKVTF
jgi:ligand-binding sensor domain-containing protein